MRFLAVNKLFNRQASCSGVSYKKLCLCMCPQDGYVHNADSKQVPLAGPGARAAIEKATTAEAMHKAVGFDCWVVVPIDSIAHADKTLEGTRLTLVRCQRQLCCLHHLLLI